MKIAFYTDHFSERGTEIGMFEYAKGNIDVLGNQSAFFVRKHNKYHHPEGIKKFTDEFSEIHWVDDRQAATRKMDDLGDIDAVFFITSQPARPEYLFGSYTTLVNQTGAMVSHENRWGDKYSYVSHWLRDHCGAPENFPVLNRPIRLSDTKDDLRDFFSLPKEAIVLGRTGGSDTWNLPEVNHSCVEALRQNKNLFFLFQNTPNAPKHDRVLHYKTTTNIELKTKFINTCDGMIHCRLEGESFGVAVAEFSSKNKPIITFAHSREKGHLSYLKEKAITFESSSDLVSKLARFEPDPDQDWNCYEHCSPENVIQCFDQIYLQ